MYGGMCLGTYVESLLKLSQTVGTNGIECGMTFVYNESLITRARNRVVDEFIKLTKGTHLLWIDADIGFNAEDVLAMLAWDKDIIGAACVKKSLDWPRIQEVIRKFPDRQLTQDEIMAVSGDFVVHHIDEKEGVEPRKLKLDEPFEVRRLGTGFLLIKREVFETLQKAYPNRKYTNIGDVSARGGHIQEFFTSRCHPETGEYLSEDYAFCDDARAQGFSVWLAPWVKTSHSGMFKFEGSLPAVAQATGHL